MKKERLIKYALCASGIVLLLVLYASLFEITTQDHEIPIYIKRMIVFELEGDFNPLEDNLFALYNDVNGNTLYYRIVTGSSGLIEIGMINIILPWKNLRVYYGINLLTDYMYVYDIDLNKLLEVEKPFKCHMQHHNLIQYVTTELVARDLLPDNAG